MLPGGFPICRHVSFLSFTLAANHSSVKPEVSIPFRVELWSTSCWPAILFDFFAASESKKSEQGTCVLVYFFLKPLESWDPL